MLKNKAISPPGIYDCRKSKSSVEQLIPMIPERILFHVQTCADEEIRRRDRVEKNWICWHQPLRYMSWIQFNKMISTCQGPVDLQGIDMPSIGQQLYQD
jgi:hypothetical protein